MRKKFFFLITVFFFLACNFSHKKTVKIGDFIWFTEYGYSDALEKAEKENKPIFAYFTANWCAPCKRVKKEIFEKKEFKKIADKVVLLRVEQTEIPGTALCRKYHIITYPSFRLLSPDGKLLDKGWSGWVNGKTVDDVYKWLEVASRSKEEFLKKPLPLNKLYAMYRKPPFVELRRFNEKERGILLYNSLKHFADSVKEKTDNSQYSTLLGYYISYLTGAYKNLKSDNEKKAFLKESDKKLFYLLKKMKDKKERDRHLVYYLSDTGRPEKALALFNKEFNEKSIAKIKDPWKKVRILTDEAELYINLANANNSELGEKINKNLLKENARDKAIALCREIIQLVKENKNNKKVMSAGMSGLKRIAEKFLKYGDKETANVIAFEAFDTLVKITDFNKIEMLKKNIDWKSKDFDMHTFWLIIYLEDFTDLKLIPDKLIQFGEKYYKKANISYKARIINVVFENYFTKKEYEKAIEFINHVFADKELMKELDSIWWNCSFYDNLAYDCLDHNVYLDLAEKWAKKALKMYKRDEYAMYILAELNARKGKYFEAIQLAKQAYDRAICRQHTDEKFIKKLKEKLKEWKQKI